MTLLTNPKHLQTKQDNTNHKKTNKTADYINEVLNYKKMAFRRIRIEKNLVVHRNANEKQQMN